jgi:hypothetical protein
MPDFKIKTETWGAENQSWLGSAHGTDATRTVTVKISTLTAGTHYPTGHVPSGLPLGKITASGLYGLYNTAASDGTEVLAGYLYTSQKVTAGNDFVAPILEHGKVITAKLPFPATTDADAIASSLGRIIHL